MPGACLPAESGRNLIMEEQYNHGILNRPSRPESCRPRRGRRLEASFLAGALGLWLAAAGVPAAGAVVVCNGVGFANFNTAGFTLQIPAGRTAAQIGAVQLYQIRTNGLRRLQDPVPIGGGTNFASFTNYAASAFDLQPGTAYSFRGVFMDTNLVIIATNMVSVTTRTDRVVGTPVASIYVATNGLDSNPGTLALPKLTLGAAFSVAAAGTHIIMRGGIYREGTLAPAGGGTAATPLVVKAYSNEVPVLDGSTAGLMKGGWVSDGDGYYHHAGVTAMPWLVAWRNRDSGAVSRMYPMATKAELDGKYSGAYPFASRDITGAYYWDGASTLYIWCPDFTLDNNVDIHVAERDTAIDLSDFSWVTISGVTFQFYQGKGVYVNTASDIWITGCTFQYIGSYIGLKRTSDRLLVENCRFTDDCSRWGFLPKGSDGYDYSGQIETGAIYVYTPYDGRGLVFRNNTIGGLFDGMHLCPDAFPLNAGSTSESDFYSNTITDVCDDFIETDGYPVNARIFDNVLENCLSGISIAQGTCGPLYVIRNILKHATSTAVTYDGYEGYPVKSNGGIKFTGDVTGWAFFYHNTGWTPVANTAAFRVQYANWRKLTLGNNIWCGTHHGWDVWQAYLDPIRCDNDFIYRESEAFFKLGGISYQTKAAAVAAQPWLASTYESNPNLVDPAGGNYHLAAGSPAVDAGVVIAGINDERYAGAAPDCGAYERYNIASTVLVTLATSPDGLVVVVDGASNAAPRTVECESNSVYAVGVPAPQDGHVPGERYAFASWSDGGAQAHSITADVARTVTAGFSTQYLLAASADDHGSVLPADVWYAAGGSGSVTAAPSVGYYFSSWSGDVPAGNAGDNPVLLAMDQARSVMANFAINTYTLTYAAGAGGAVDGITTQVVAHGAGGSAVTAVPDPGCGFTGWSDGVMLNPRMDTNVTGNITVSAGFTNINCYTLVYAAGSNGSISGESPQIVVEHGDGLAVAAMPDAGCRFAGWSDGVTANPRTDAGVTSSISVTAGFALNQYMLAYAADAGGTISGLATQTVDYGGSGSAVAAVTNSGYGFLRWSDGSTANPRTDANVASNISVMALFFPDAAGIRYVKADAAGANNGSSWAHAYTQLTNALALASAGDEIWVAAGIYKPGTNASGTFALRANVPVYGGFKGAETVRAERDWVANVAVLSGEIGTAGISDNINKIVTGVAGGTLDGVRLELCYGTGTGHGAVVANNAGPMTVRNCSFVGNYASGGDGGSCIYYYNSGTNALAVESCAFYGNCVTGAVNGAVVLSGSANRYAAVRNCLFSGNTYSGKSSNRSTTLASIRGSATTGPVVASCTFANNTGGTGGVIGSGIGNVLACLDLRNCIIRGGGVQLRVPAAGSVTYQNCAVPGVTLAAWASITGTLVDEGGHVYGDPLLADEAGADHLAGTPDDDLHLQTNSPCKDAGTATDAPPADFEGMLRPQGSGYDIGAYEYAPSNTLTYIAGANGAISGASLQTVRQGGSGTAVTAVPDPGHHFAGWSDSSTNNPRTDLNVTSNISVTASFAINHYTLAASAGGGGTISPEGAVDVVHGGGQAFAISADEHHGVADVRVDGVSVGATGAYTFAAVDMDHAIAASFVPDGCSLEIVSAHGMPGPPVGISTNPYGTVLTNGVATPDTQGMTQYVCTGWAMLGNRPTGGDSAVMVMTVTNPAVLGWLWKTQYNLAVGAAEGGSAGGGGWCDEGAVTSLLAVASDGHGFAGWSGDVAGLDTNDNPVAVPMDCARSLTASFGITACTLTVNSPHGVAVPGTVTTNWGAELALFVASTPVYEGVLATQYVCVGASVSGNSFTPDGTTRVTLRLTNSATLTWVWTTNYWLDTGVSGSGTVSVSNEWVGAGSNVLVGAQALPCWHFTGWTGTLESADNPLQLAMTQSCAAVAVFAMNLTTNADPVPEQWLADHGLTNQEWAAEALDDQDQDGMESWQEWVADTDPTNPASFLGFDSFVRDGADLHISWHGGALSTQYLERAVGMGANIEWAAVFTNPPPTPAAVEFLERNATNAGGLYRIRAMR